HARPHRTCHARSAISTTPTRSVPVYMLSPTAPNTLPLAELSSFPFGSLSFIFSLSLCHTHTHTHIQAHSLSLSLSLSFASHFLSFFSFICSLKKKRERYFSKTWL